MKRIILTIISIACLASAWTIADTDAFEIITRDMVEKEVVTKTDLIRIVDNFIVLFDTSGSTNEMVPGRDVTKIQAAKKALKERNAWFPDLGYRAGLYIYTDNQTLTGTFKEVVGMQPYDRKTFDAGIDQLPDKGQGPTMLQAGLHGLRKVLDGLSGKTAVIMLTDGSFSVIRGPKKPLEIAQDLAKEHDVCFYLISSATDDVNANLLKAVSAVNACSRVIPIQAFLDNPQYLSGALFTVKTTSYERLKPITQVVGVVTDPVLFDFNDAAIRSEYNDGLNMLGDYLRGNPEAYLVVGGYADSIGDEGYNLALSERRAASVKGYLVNTSGIDAARIVDLWFGEINPAADNATEEGRQRNRRVEIAVGGVQ